MAEETKVEGIVSEEKTRRSAIKTAAQVAVTAPAVGLLLSASTKSASAAVQYVHTANGSYLTDDGVTFDDGLGNDDVTVVDDITIL
jgi:hypothetical protein